MHVLVGCRCFMDDISLVYYWEKHVCSVFKTCLAMSVCNFGRSGPPTTRRVAFRKDGPPTRGECRLDFIMVRRILAQVTELCHPFISPQPQAS